MGGAWTREYKHYEREGGEDEEDSHEEETVGVKDLDTDEKLKENTDAMHDMAKAMADDSDKTVAGIKKEREETKGGQWNPLSKRRRMNSPRL